MSADEVAVDEAVDGVLICGATAARCICVLGPDHEAPVHECRESCGGKWSGDYGGEDFTVIAFPGLDVL